MWLVGVKFDVHYVVKEQKALVWVLSVETNYVPTSFYEIRHAMYSTGTGENYEVTNIYTMAVHFFC